MMSAHFKTVWRFYFYVMFPWFIEAIHKVGAFWCCLVFCLSESRCLESTVSRLIQVSTCGLGWFPTNLIGQLHAHVIKRGGAAVMASFVKASVPQHVDSRHCHSGGWVFRRWTWGNKTLEPLSMPNIRARG